MAAAASVSDAPEVTVVISGALRALWAARNAPEPAPVPAAAPPLAPRQARRPENASRFRIRRDGLRPLVFEGEEVMRQRLDDVAGPDGPVSLDLALYRRAEGDLVGAASATFREDGPTRPIHLAGAVGSRDDFRRLLERLDRGLRVALARASAEGPGRVETETRRLLAELATGLTNPSIIARKEEYHDVQN